MRFLLKRKYLVVLFLIVCLAGFFRFTMLGEYPVSLYWDEAAMGYNAYSIAQTGNDEYGKTLPVLFRSFNDYKASGYIYLTALIIPLFGLNEFSIRFWSAGLGTVTVLLSYFLTLALLDLFEKHSKESSVFYVQRKKIALLTAAFLAISPWHVHFSRIGFEANAALFFIILGAWLVIKSVAKINILFVIGMIAFSLSFYFYRSTYVFTPLFLLGLFVILRKDFLRQIRNKYLWVGIGIFLLIFLPFLPTMISNEGLVRAKQTSVFNSFEEDLNRAAIKRQKLGDPLWARVFYDRRVIYTQKIFENYITHFSPSFLFIEGDRNGRHKTEGFGQMYLWEAIFLLAGLYVLIKLPQKPRNIIILWLLIAPIAAAVSQPSPHALRSLNMLPMPQILTALGLYYIYSLVKPQFRTTFIVAIISIAGIFSVKYIYQYHFTSLAVSKDWADGYKQLATYIFQKENEYDKIVVSGHFWQPHMYFLLYKQYPPELYQEKGSKAGFDKYLFGGTSWDQGEELDKVDLRKYAKTDNILIALSQEEYNFQKNNIKVLKKIYNHNKELVFIIGELKDDKKVQ